MLSKSELDQYIDKSIHLRTLSGLYLKLDDVSDKNNSPSFIFTPNRNYASEFILVKKTETNVAIRLNIDIMNQNGTFGYHLYVIPENDVVYGAGNDELFAQFNIERDEQYILIKSAFKNSYFCYEYNILRCRPKNNSCRFIIEEAHIPFVQRSICVISYGYQRRNLDLTKSPIINTLIETYPQSSIDIYMLLPEDVDEFQDNMCNININKPSQCNLFISTHTNNAKHFIKMANSSSLPIISNRNRNYPFRVMSMLWNITESVRNVITAKRVYNSYILMRNDMFMTTQIFKKILDTTKLYCVINNNIDSHLFIGKDILLFNYLYDYYIRNKLSYVNDNPEKIIYDFLASHNVSLGNIYHLSPYVNYPSNLSKYEDSFYKLVVSKYRETVGDSVVQKK